MAFMSPIGNLKDLTKGAAFSACSLVVLFGIAAANPLGLVAASVAGLGAYSQSDILSPAADKS